MQIVVLSPPSSAAGTWSPPQLQSFASIVTPRTKGPTESEVLNLHLLGLLQNCIAISPSHRFLSHSLQLTLNRAVPSYPYRTIYIVYTYIYICIYYIYICRSQAGLIIPTLHARLELHGHLSKPSFCAPYCPLLIPLIIFRASAVLSCPLAPI